MLAGGLLAQGVRPIETREDWLYDRAGRYYWFFTTFPGWTKSIVDELPPWLRDRLPDVHKIVKKIEQERQEAADREAQSQQGR